MYPVDLVRSFVSQHRDLFHGISRIEGLIATLGSGAGYIDREGIKQIIPPDLYPRFLQFCNCTCPLADSSPGPASDCPLHAVVDDRSAPGES
jgi:hypothetical protein